MLNDVTKLTSQARSRESQAQKGVRFRKETEEDLNRVLRYDRIRRRGKAIRRP